jgi:photosystem II stability/assembly factor-like uncharacterized protein
MRYQAVCARTSTHLVRFALLVILAATFPGARLTAQRVAAKKSADVVKLAGDTVKKFKAIWEPVNYSEDAVLRDVFFVSADEGWVVGMKSSTEGEGGFILHTKDGGDHWNVQLGDPHSATRSPGNLFFLDATHGWAAQFGGQLLRTSDGENWENVGKFSVKDFAFVSPQVGFTITGAELERTDNAGASWKPVYQCTAKLVVNGLTRDSGCDFLSLSFPTSSVGYVTTSELPDNSFDVHKTTDGGATWSKVGNVGNHRPGGHGLGAAGTTAAFSTTYQQAIVASFDGGQTWSGVPANQPGGSPRILFADSRVGWIVEGTTFTYTSNGGRRWNSSQLHLPGRVNAFSLPTSDRGYVIGDHGMIYRYRVVPLSYTSKGMLAAPPM